MSITEYNEEETMKLFAAEYLAEGREEGATQKQHENVVRMLGKNVSPENIANYLDVSVDYVKQIEAEMLVKA